MKTALAALVLSAALLASGAALAQRGGDDSWTRESKVPPGAPTLSDTLDRSKLKPVAVVGDVPLLAAVFGDAAARKADKDDHRRAAEALSAALAAPGEYVLWANPTAHRSGQVWAVRPLTAKGGEACVEFRASVGWLAPEDALAVACQSQGRWLVLRKD